MIIQLSEFFEEDLFVPRLEAKDKEGALREMVGALVEAGLDLLALYRKRSQLESVFLDLTGGKGVEA